MNRTDIIRKILAGMMLSIFIFSVTPKIYLHDLLTDHDDYYGQAAGKELTFSQSGYQCDTQDLVVSVPFIEIASEPVFTLPVSFRSFTLSFIPSFYVSQPLAKDSRGPPSRA